MALQWTGKLVGGLIGMVTLGPPGALLGVLVGHQWDVKSRNDDSEPASFADAALVVVDSERAADEAGDLQQAEKSGLVSGKRATLAHIVSGQAAVPREGMILFKSVGTALQDLALGRRYYEVLGEQAGRPVARELASLKVPVTRA